jgi:hypothetical protein
MKPFLLFFFIITVVNCFAQGNSDTAGQLSINNVSLQKSGLIEWSTTNEKTDTKFVIEELRWKKWLTITEIDGKGAGNNFYSFLADTTCGIYTIKIRSGENFSSMVTYPSPIIITYKGGFKRPIKFNHKTKFEVYDILGDIIMQGCDIVIDTKNLKRGDYFLNYGNVFATFLKYD